jgi:hypothetical protein
MPSYQAMMQKKMESRRALSARVRSEVVFDIHVRNMPHQESVSESAAVRLQGQSRGWER